MSAKEFFNFSLHQTISQWLTIPFVALMGLSVVTYYLVNKTSDRVDTYIASRILDETTYTR